VDGYAAGIRAGASLAAIYEGQHGAPGKVESAGLKTAELLRETLEADRA
jgi:hypothetical protein